MRKGLTVYSSEGPFGGLDCTVSALLISNLMGEVCSFGVGRHDLFKLSSAVVLGFPLIGDSGW